MVNHDVNAEHLVFHTTQWPLDKSHILSYVCALLNGAGGALVFGSDADGNVAGVPDNGVFLKKLEEVIRFEVSPSPLVMSSTDKINGKVVVTYVIPKGSEPPYLYEGKAYCIHDGMLSYADAELLRRLVMRSTSQPVRWEERFSLADVDGDLDMEELWRAAEDVTSRKRLELPHASEVTEQLRFFGVYKDGRLTNAGDLLFTRKPSLRLPQTRIRAYAYATDKVGAMFLDSEMIEAPLCQAISKSLLFIARNTSTPDHFEGTSLYRATTMQYPEAALREALVNAVAHRDYVSPSGGVAIHVYPNRLEIWNSGDLPDGVQPDRLGKDQVSIIRNPSVAYVLYLRGLMEQSGRGSLKMVEACQRENLPPPEWRVQQHVGVTVVFQRIIPTDHSGPKDGPLGNPMSKSVSNSPKMKVIEALMHSDGLNRLELVTLTRIPEGSIKRILAELIQCGRIVRINGRRFGKYCLVKEDEMGNSAISYDYKAC